jgi:hypothetical protein
MRTRQWSIPIVTLSCLGLFACGITPEAEELQDDSIEVQVNQLVTLSACRTPPGGVPLDQPGISCSSYGMSQEGQRCCKPGRPSYSARINYSKGKIMTCHRFVDEWHYDPPRVIYATSMDGDCLLK